MIIDNWVDSYNEILGDNCDMKLVSSENITVCHFDIKENVDLASHKHDHEQITVVLEGTMVIQYGEVTRTLEKGDVCVIPGGVPHEAKIVKTPFKSLDIFNPIREDFIENITKYAKTE